MSEHYEVIERCRDKEEAARRTRYQVGRKAVISGLNICNSGKDYVVIPDFTLLPSPKEGDINLYTYREGVREAHKRKKNNVSPGQEQA